MLDFTLRGSFITADTPAKRAFIIAASETAMPVAETLGYHHLSAGRTDKEGKIAYLEFVPQRGRDAHKGPSAKVDLYPVAGKAEKTLADFVTRVFRLGLSDGESKMLKYEEINGAAGPVAAYAIKQVGPDKVQYAAVFRRDDHLFAVTLRAGEDPDDIPGKDKLKDFLPEGKTE